jgi:hypothetical protein
MVALGKNSFTKLRNGSHISITTQRTFSRPAISANDSINAYVQNNDIPSIEDADGDGDLDMLAFDVQGVYTVMHKNMRVEYGLPCDSLKMEIADKCWGKFFQTFNREVYTNSFCTPAFISNKKKLADNAEHLWNQVCSYARHHSQPEKQSARAWHLYKKITGQETQWQFSKAPTVEISRNVHQKIQQLNIAYKKGMAK